MATSGNTIALINQEDIMSDALGHLGVLGEGQVLNAPQIAKGARLLNNIVAEFRTLGMQAWARSELQIVLGNGTFVYNIGVGETINTPYPTFIYDIEMVQPTSGNKFTMTSMAITDFTNLPLLSTGTPVNYNYQPKNNTGVLQVWPTPDATLEVGSYLAMTYQRPIEVFDNLTDDMDFPQEWGNALTFTLALVWADTYGVPEAKKAWLEKQSDRHIGNAASITNEQGSMFFQPENNGRFGGG